MWTFMVSSHIRSRSEAVYGDGSGSDTTDTPVLVCGPG